VAKVVNTRGTEEFEIILDFDKGIRFSADTPPILHAHAIESHRHGLHHLAEQTRILEQQYIDNDKHGSGHEEELFDFGYWHPVEICRFDWFAISLANYLRLIALVDLAARNHWSLPDLVNQAETVSDICSEYVDEIAPAVHLWRNKVAAHPAATAPRKGAKNRDALGTLLQSYSYPVTRKAGYFEVGRGRWTIDGESSVIKPWSLTATYERLTPRFWPDTSITSHRHRLGLEPKDEPGTHLYQVRRTT
jgi:hypothetical protein